MRIGYAMTAGAERTLEEQRAALTAAGCAQIFTDALDADPLSRPGLRVALGGMRAGDALVVCQLDRLGRSQRRLLEILTALQARHIGLVSLAEGFDATSQDGQLTIRNFSAVIALPPVALPPRAAHAEPAPPPDARPGEDALDGHALDALDARPRKPRGRASRALVALAAIVAVGLLYLLCYSVLPTYDRYTGRVVSTHILTSNATATTQAVMVLVTSGNLNGHTYTLTANYPTGFATDGYAPGDNVLLGWSPGSAAPFLDTLDRRGYIFILLLLFVALVVLVARWQGLLSLLGMALSVVVILALVIPNALVGRDPLPFALLAALVIIPATYYLAHGVHRKTTVAIVATFVTLALTFVLAVAFTRLMKLPLVVSVDNGGLLFTDNQWLFYANTGQAINAQSLYLAALLIGALAALNDITISQASIVTSLFRANPALGLRALFLHAMSVGRDHVASLINTLFLVYLGASFTLVLTAAQRLSLGSLGISDPDIAADLLRTVVISIGIVVAVPIATALAAYLTLHRRL